VVLEPEVADAEAFLETARAALPEEFAGAVLTVVDAVEPAKLTRPRITRTAPAEPPATPTEETLAAMLVALLGVTEVGRYDDFFTLGGDSILAVQLAARARDAGVAMTARMVFEHPGLADLAAAIDSAGDDADGTVVADVHHEPMSASGLSPDELAALTAGWGQDQGIST
jgi:mycobactin peptide synthetase MbtE